MATNQQLLSGLADMLKAVGHPLRIQIVAILTRERIVSIPTLQRYLGDVDPFFIYGTLRYMHKKSIVKKLRKGREIYYGLSDKAIVAGFDTFFQRQFDLTTRPELKPDLPLSRISGKTANNVVTRSGN
ncbi:hypothetical protein [Spirosoma sp.]|uniref:hypothetical protein n=1 Tax=Spirosoma sp. TaxID=1899569 RepID=UPI003B3A9857